MHGRLIGLGLVLSTAVIACGGSKGDEQAPEAPAAVVAAPPQSAAPAQPSTPQVTTPPSTTPPPTTTPPPSTPTCGASTLCLDVSSLGQAGNVAAGRLVVVWIPLAGGTQEIGYDAAFAGTEKQVQVPLASVTAPSDNVAFCAKGSNGQCSGNVKMAFGLVGILEDSGAGKAVLGQRAVGLSDANVLFSQNALKPAPKDFVWNGVPMDQAFPSGVEQGTNVYLDVKGNFTNLVPAQTGATFKLQVCDAVNAANGQCRVNVPFAP